MVSRSKTIQLESIVLPLQLLQGLKITFLPRIVRKGAGHFGPGTGVTGAALDPGDPRKTAGGPPAGGRAAVSLDLRAPRYGQCAIRYSASVIMMSAASGSTFLPLCASSSLMNDW